MKIIDADAHVVESAHTWDYQFPTLRWGFVEASAQWLPLGCCTKRRTDFAP